MASNTLTSYTRNIYGRKKLLIVWKTIQLFYLNYLSTVVRVFVYIHSGLTLLKGWNQVEINSIVWEQVQVTHQSHKKLKPLCLHCQPWGSYRCMNTPYCTTAALPDLSWSMCNDITKGKSEKTTVPQNSKSSPPTTTAKSKQWYELNALKH